MPERGLRRRRHGTGDPLQRVDERAGAKGAAPGQVFEHLIIAMGHDLTLFLDAGGRPSPVLLE